VIHTESSRIMQKQINYVAISQYWRMRNRISRTAIFLGAALCHMNSLNSLVGASESYDVAAQHPARKLSAYDEIHAQALSDAVATLKLFGVNGIESLCHPVYMDFSPSIPLCDDDDSMGKHHFREIRRFLRKKQRGLGDPEKEATLSTRERRLTAASEDSKAQNQQQYSSRRNLNEKPAEEDRDASFYVFNIGGAIVSIVLVAVIAGMFLGFLTLDPLDLRIKMRAAVDPSEREAAAAIFPLVNQNHRLLVTLLIMNALAYECLPLFLDNLMPTYLTIVFSVSLLLIFGEIVPSAIFTGPDQLVLASKLAPIVKWAMRFLHPISRPLVKLLDSLVPSDDENEEEYNRAELSALVRIQYEERVKAQKQRDLANSVNFVRSNGARSPVNGARHSIIRKNQHVQFIANHLKAEKVRRKQVQDHEFHSQRSWRRLKEEIMYAVAEKQQSESTSVISNLFDGIKPSAEDSFHEEGGIFSRHRRTASSSSAGSLDPIPLEQIAPPLEKTEVKVVEGALNLKTMCALDVYTPLRMVFAVPEDMELTKENMAEIYGQGWSRVPVYEPQPPPNEHRITAVKGILMTRQLIMVDWDDERTVGSLPLYIPPCVSPRMNLVNLLHLLRGGGSLIAFVCAGPHLAERALREGRSIPAEAGFMGLVTLQDVLESVLQERIYDEEDVAQRNLASAILTNWAAEKIQKLVLKRRKLKRLGSGAGSHDASKVDGSHDLSSSPEKNCSGFDDFILNDRTPLLV